MARKAPTLGFYIFTPTIFLVIVFLIMEDAWKYSETLLVYPEIYISVFALTAVAQKYAERIRQNLEPEEPHYKKFERKSERWFAYVTLAVIAWIAYMIIQKPIFNPASVAMLTLGIGNVMAWLGSIYMDRQYELRQAAGKQEPLQSCYPLFIPLLILPWVFYFLLPVWTSGAVFLDGVLCVVPAMMLGLMVLLQGKPDFALSRAVFLVVVLGVVLLIVLAQVLLPFRPETFNKETVAVIVFALGSFIFLVMQVIDKFIYARPEHKTKASI